MVFFTETWKPDSFYDRVVENVKLGLHTLVLLDIKVKEPDLNMLARGRVVYEKPRFMTVSQCAEQLIEIEEVRNGGICGKDRLAVGVARVGAEDQSIVCGTLDELTKVDMGRPLHSLVVIGKRVHDMERDFIREFAVNVDTFDRAWNILVNS